MRLLATALFSFLFDGHALRAQNPANKLTSNEAKEEWILLFDGRSLNGWQGRPNYRPGEQRRLECAEWRSPLRRNRSQLDQHQQFFFGLPSDAGVSWCRDRE